MIKVNIKDGKTLSFESDSEEDLKTLREKLGNKEFLDSITGVSSLHNTYWHALTKPKRFRNVSYHVEEVKFKKGDIEKVVGERIVCQADDIQLVILVYYNNRPKMTRIELKKIGKRRFAPKENINGPNSEES